MNLKKLTAASCAAIMLLLTTGCETFAGLGRDMQKAGEKMEKSAEREEKES